MATIILTCLGTNAGIALIGATILYRLASWAVQDEEREEKRRRQS